MGARKHGIGFPPKKKSPKKKTQEEVKHTRKRTNARQRIIYAEKQGKAPKSRDVKAKKKSEKFLSELRGATKDANQEVRIGATHITTALEGGVNKNLKTFAKNADKHFDTSSDEYSDNESQVSGSSDDEATVASKDRTSNGLKSDSSDRNDDDSVASNHGKSESRDGEVVAHSLEEDGSEPQTSSQEEIKSLRKQIESLTKKFEAEIKSLQGQVERLRGENKELQLENEDIKGLKAEMKSLRGDIARLSVDKKNIQCENRNLRLANPDQGKTLFRVFNSLKSILSEVRKQASCKHCGDECDELIICEACGYVVYCQGCFYLKNSEKCVICKAEKGFFGPVPVAESARIVRMIETTMSVPNDSTTNETSNDSDGKVVLEPIKEENSAEAGHNVAASSSGVAAASSKDIVSLLDSDDEEYQADMDKAKKASLAELDNQGLAVLKTEENEESSVENDLKPASQPTVVKKEETDSDSDFSWGFGC